MGGGQTQPTGGQPGPTKGTGLAPNIASLMCYICMPITSIIFLLIEKENADVKFHAWQGTTFGVATIIAWLALWFLSTIFGYVASVLGIMISFFIPIIALIYFILMIVGIVKAYQGERWRIPIVGDFAAKKAGL